MLNSLLQLSVSSFHIMTEPTHYMVLPYKSAGPYVFGKKARKSDLDPSKTFKGEIMVIILGALWTIDQQNTPGYKKKAM